MLNQSRFFLFITCQCVRKYVWRVLKPRWYLIMITTFVLARKIGKFISRKYIGRWLNILWHFREKKINCEFCMNLSWFKNVSFKGHLALVVLGKNTYIHAMKNFQNAHFSNIQSIKSWPLSEKKKKMHQ